MGFWEATKTCLRKYVTFSGRASRSEFWWFYLFTILLGFAASFLDALLSAGEVFYTIVSIAVFLPVLSAGVRRFHDTNRSGWYVLLLMVIIIVSAVFAVFVTISNSPTNETLMTFATVASVVVCISAVIVWIVFLAQKSDPGHNDFGPNPFDEANIEAVFE